mgnify:CR=1 FL=1
MAVSKIQWTDATWNIARGCKKVDSDCKYCYMYRDSMNGTRYEPKEIKRTKTVFDFPLKYTETYSKSWAGGKPLIFTSSLTDVFLPEIDSYRNEMWDIIRKCPHLIFQILTKRPERIQECLPHDWNDGWDNVWLGTSVGSNESIQRIKDLVLKVDAKVKFLSLEPMHSQIDLNEITVKTKIGELYVIPGIDWVIVGGESGHDTGKYRYRECKLEWIEKVVKDCEANQIPVFVKQLGTHLSKQLKLKDRHGGDIEEFPQHLRIRNFPNLNKTTV